MKKHHIISALVVFAAVAGFIALVFALTGSEKSPDKKAKAKPPATAPATPGPTADQPPAVSPASGSPARRSRKAEPTAADPAETALPPPHSRTMGYGTSDIHGKVETTSLPPGCKVTQESYLPGCESLLGASVAIHCGQNGDFCLAVYPFGRSNAAKRAALKTLLIAAYQRHHRYKSWGRFTAQTAPVVCNPDGACRYETAEMCPWMTARTTDCTCAGQTEIRVMPTPRHPGLEGHTYVSIVTGLWNIRRYDEGQKVFGRLLKSAKWSVFEDKDED
jgi:hypothetical protein